MGHIFKQKTVEVSIPVVGATVATIPINNMREFAVDIINTASITVNFSLISRAIDQPAANVTLLSSAVTTSAVSRNLIENSHASDLIVSASATAAVGPIKIVVTSVGEGN